MITHTNNHTTYFLYDELIPDGLVRVAKTSKFMHFQCVHSTFDKEWTICYVTNVQRTNLEWEVLLAQIILKHFLCIQLWHRCRSSVCPVNIYPTQAIRLIPPTIIPWWHSSYTKPDPDLDYYDIIETMID